MITEPRAKLVELLREAGRAHHKAFAATDGADPDWPTWYADYLKEPFAEQLDLDFEKCRLTQCLMNADVEHQARSRDSDWAEYYADQIVERCMPSETPKQDKLALYHFDGCPFCGMVRSAIEQLGVEVELRDIFEDSQHHDDLIKARGRATVPVLPRNS